MKSILCILATVLAIAVANPQVLTAGNFESTVTNGDVWFVKFFAPWCGHCKRLAPTWEKLSTDLAFDSTLHIATVDCTVERDLCNDQGIRGYPTLMVFRNGNKEAIKYSGGRTYEDLKAFMMKQSSKQDEDD